MAKPTLKKVMTRYRKLSGMPFHSASVTLQEAVTEALNFTLNGTKLRDDYGLRECTELFQTDDTFVLAAPAITDDYFFCELARFEKGANIPLCWGNPNDPSSLIIGQQKPGQGREALLGVLQFMIVENHLILIESASVRTSRLEEYITWLLKYKTKKIGQNSHLILETEFDISALKGTDASDVKEIALRPVGLRESNMQTSDLADQTVKREAKEVTKGNIFRQILELLGNTEADIDKLVKDVPSGADVELHLSLLFKKARRKGAGMVSTASAKHLFRNLDNEEIALKNAAGKVVGKLMSISKEQHVKLNGSIVDFNDAAVVLWNSYVFWKENGQIT